MTTAGRALFEQATRFPWNSARRATLLWLASAALALAGVQAHAQWLPGRAPGLRPGFQFIGGGCAYQPSGATAYADFVGNCFSGISLSISRASSKYIDDLAGNWKFVPPNTLAQSDKGTLIEGAQTNLFLWSSEYEVGSWGKSALTVSVGTDVGYDQTATADTIFPSNVNSEHWIRQIPAIPAGSLNTFSAFVKPAGTDRIQLRFLGQQTTTSGGVARFNLSSGVVETVSSLGAGSSVSAGMQKYGEYWRVWVSGIVNGTDTGWICDQFIMQPTGGGNNTAFAGVTTQGLTLWGSQLETWPSSVTTVGGPSSPIRTAGTAATRAADVVTATLPNGLSAGGMAVVFNQFIQPQNVATLARLGTATDRIELRTNGTAGQMAATVGGAGQTPAQTAGGVATFGVRHAIAGAFAAGDLAISVDGSVSNTAAPTSVPAEQTALTLGGGTVTMFGYLERFALWPYRPANSNVQTYGILQNWGG